MGPLSTEHQQTIYSLSLSLFHCRYVSQVELLPLPLPLCCKCLKQGTETQALTHGTLLMRQHYGAPIIMGNITQIKGAAATLSR